MIFRERVILFIGFIIPMMLFTNYVLNQFYAYGSGLLDVGWFTYMITESVTWPIQNPQAIGGTFFQTHFSLFFYILSYIYKYILFFIPAPVYYSLFIGSMYGIISVSILLAGFKLIEKGNFKYAYLLLIAAILSAMNGAALGLIGFPHVEIAIPALLVLFLSLYLTDRKNISYIVFIFLLTIREDSGLHVFAILIIAAVLSILSKRQLTSTSLSFIFLAFVGFIFSILAMYIQKKYFPGDNALERIYLGNPHFSHITTEFLIDRIGYFFSNREYLYLPIFFTIILYFYTKNIFLLSAVLASTPWILLSLIAINNMPGTLSNYYAFPLILNSIWPVFSFLIAKNDNVSIK